MFALAGGLALPAVAADIPDEQFAISAPPTLQDSLGVVIEDSQFLKNQFSSLQSHVSSGKLAGTSKLIAKYNCKTVGDVNCESDKYFMYMALLGACDSNFSFDCVQKISATNSNGKSLNVKYVEDFPSKMPFEFTGNSKINLPSGRSTFVVDIPEAPHAGGSNYLVVAELIGSKDSIDIKFRDPDLSIGLIAVSKELGSYSPAGPATELHEGDRLGVASYKRVSEDMSTGSITSCAQTTNSACLQPYPLPADITFSATVKLRTKVRGWLHGRAQSVNALISEAVDGDQLITVEGKATKVPTVYAWFEKTALPKSVSDFYSKNADRLTSGTGFGSSIPGNKGSLLKDNISYSEYSLNEALAWFAAINDKAPYLPTQWSFRSTNDNADPKGCYQKLNSLSGIVTTNSTFFLSGPPTFNTSEQSLDYRVASPHLTPTGEVFKGSYNLVINSKTARCLYGFTSAPISATVSVISSDGTKSIASTVVGERNGYLFLSAQGFTFSSPTLRVKLSQKKNQSYSITCTKGKTSKKVTGVNPKCPKGYVKK